MSSRAPISDPVARPLLLVAVPACDEEEMVEESLRSIQEAAEQLNDPSLVRIVLACDSCTDSTQNRADRMAALDPRIIVISGAWRSAGACRAAAMRAGLSDPRLAGVDLADIWLCTTDADTVVAVDWLLQHVESWVRGDDAVAGIVDIHADHHASPEVVDAFRRTYAVGHDTHGHVHGANLGVRADAYAAVGGFPDLALAEEHAIWHRLLEAGMQCRSSVSLRVATSGRLHSRAPGGFADAMRAYVLDGIVADASGIGVPA